MQITINNDIFCYGMKKKAINIENISCANCISKISRVLIRKGVHSVKGNTLLKKILIKYNDSKISSNNIKQALKDNGFLFKISKKLYKRLLIYSTMVYIIFLLSNYLHNNINIAFIISTINIIIILYNLRHKFYNLLDELMIIGSISSYFLGIVSYLFESDELYEDYSTSITFFDVSMLIIIFLLVKECILENIQNKQLKFINKLEKGDFRKTVTKKIIDGKEIEVDIDKIMVGDIILLEKNDVVLVDGHIIEGEAFIDQSNITGESYPESVKEKDKILSGSKILSGKIKIKVENTGKNSLIGKFLSNIKTATYQKSDEFSNFHKIIFFISILASLFYMILGLLNIKPYALYVSDYIIISSLKVGLTILTVSCPCALIISKPLLLLGTIKKLAKDGIIIRNYNGLLINSIDIIFLDKTGTITDFNAKSIKFKILKNPTITKKELFNILNVLEKDEKHPIANIIYNYTLKYTTKHSITIQNKKFHSGKGLEANIILNNITYNIKIGNKDYILTKENIIKEITNKNKKIYISVNNKIEYIIYIKERIHNNILTTINKIKKNHIEIILISGDSKENTKPIAKKLNVKYFSNKSSEDKSTIIKKYITDKNNYIKEKNKYMK
ncbi:Heavy metal translocating P-type ATPase, partial [Spraguea lophii 42_110]